MIGGLKTISGFCFLIAIGEEMAFPTFKSTSKRGNPSPSPKPISAPKDADLLDNSGKKILTRRSRSVSSLSRSTADVSGFSNKRDNPLYCWSSSSSPESEVPVETFKGRIDASASGSRTGRAVSRNSGFGPRSANNRSLSTMDTGRRIRSVSRDRHGNSESEVDHGFRSASSISSKEIDSFAPNSQKKAGTITENFDDPEETRSLRTWTSQHPVSDSWRASNLCSKAQSWEDGISSSSFSEAEETMIRESSHQDHTIGDGRAGAIYETVRSEVQRAVSEIRNDIEYVIRRKNPSIAATENIVDIPSDDNPAIELVSDITREYVMKLEQSQERARKLRADLAIEEQRGQELNQILKEILEDPKTSDTHRFRSKRKASMERFKMSRRLAEEAMHYFDECVSISTIDSSDFSSLDDPQPSSAVSNPPMSSSRFFPNEASAFLGSRSVGGHHYHHEDSEYQTPCSLSIAGSDLAIGSSCSGSKAMHADGNHDDLPSFDALQSGNLCFSFAHETVGVGDIRHYISNFGRELRKGGASMGSNYNADDYDLDGSAESLLHDKVIYRNRIESGGLLVCDIRIF